MALITLAELKTYMRDEQVTVDDSLYTTAAAAAERSINRFCHRTFVASGASSARVYYPTGSDMQYIGDCTAITTVTLNGATLTSGTDYQAEPLNLIEDDGNAWPIYRLRRLFGQIWMPAFDNSASLSVNAAWGWSAIPDDVKMAAYIIAKDMLKQREVNAGVAGFAEYGAVRVQTNKIAVQLLEPYVRADRAGV